MRFSIIAISLFSLAVGSNALPGDPVDPAYIRSWDLSADSAGRFGRGPNPILLDGGEVRIPLLLQSFDNSNALHGWE